MTWRLIKSQHSTLIISQTDQGPLPTSCSVDTVDLELTSSGAQSIYIHWAPCELRHVKQKQATLLQGMKNKRQTQRPYDFRKEWAEFHFDSYSEGVNGGFLSEAAA